MADTKHDAEPLDSLSLIERIEEIKSEMPGRDSNGYHSPSQDERTEFAAATSLVMARGLGGHRLGTRETVPQ